MTIKGTSKRLGIEVGFTYNSLHRKALKLELSISKYLGTEFAVIATRK